jgi:outer membrane protein assembly factor BamB
MVAFRGTLVALALLIVGSLGSSLAFAEGPQEGAPWAQFKRTGTKSSLSPVNGPSTLAQRWAVGTDGAVTGGPVIGADGTIYVVTDTQRLVAIRPDGSRRFSFTPADAGGRFTYPVITSRNRIVFGTATGYVIAVNPDGGEVWRFDTRNAPYGGTDPQAIHAPPAAAVNYGRLLIGTEGSNVYELDDGIYAGVRRATEAVRAGAAVTPDGTLVWASHDRTVYGGHAGGGDKFRIRIDGRIESTPAVSPDNIIYVGTDVGSLYAIRTDGTVRWNVRVGEGRPLRGSPAVGPDGTIYIGSDEGRLYAFDPNTGAQKWSYGTGGAITGAPAIGANGLIYFGSLDHSLYVLNPNGQLQSSHRTDGQIDGSSPAIGADGTVYIGSRDGRVYAFTEGGPPPTPAPAPPPPAAPVAPAPAPPPPPPPPPVAPVAAPTDRVPPGTEGVYFFETGHNVRGAFLEYFNANGGLRAFGYPRTEEFAQDGKIVQWFQRARMEYDPALAGTPYEVQLGLLGDELLIAMGLLPR